MNVSTGIVINGNIAGSRLNHHFVFVKFWGEKKIETEESYSRVKGLEGGHNLYLAMAPDYIIQMCLNSAEFNPLRIIYIGLTFSIGLYMLRIWILSDNCFQDIADTLFIFFGFQYLFEIV